MTELSALLEKHGVRTSKALGQNFLRDGAVIEKIADAAGSGALAIEIGAGPALLSRELCKRFERVVTVEIDRSLAPLTDEVLAGVKNHTMIYADFLKTDLKELSDGGATVVGNLPYNLTGDILAKLLKARERWQSAVIMIQREAAEKLCARPGGEAYRAISVLTQYFCDVSAVCDVSPDCFIPAPHVWSRVLKLKRRDVPLSADDTGRFFTFVHAVFSQRRKMLTSIFREPEKKEKIKNALKTLGYPEKSRGEQLSPDELYFIYCEQI